MVVAEDNKLKVLQLVSSVTNTQLTVLRGQVIMISLDGAKVVQ